MKVDDRKRSAGCRFCDAASLMKKKSFRGLFFLYLLTNIRYVNMTMYY